jgi:hypothetical protein
MASEFLGQFAEFKKRSQESESRSQEVKTGGALHSAF